MADIGPEKEEPYREILPDEDPIPEREQLPEPVPDRERPLAPAGPAEQA